MNGTEIPEDQVVEEGQNQVAVLEYSRNILALLPPATRAQLEKAMESRPLLFGHDESGTMKILKKLRAMPNPTDNCLRLAFWREYDAAQNDIRDMKLVNIFTGICTQQYFTDVYLKCPERVAWLLCAPRTYEASLDEALSYGIAQLREILELPLVDEKGKINTSLASLKERIVARLHDRKHGATVQRTLSVNVGVDGDDVHMDKKVKEQLLASSMADIQRRLQALDARDRMKCLSVPKDEVVVEQVKNGK